MLLFCLPGRFEHITATGEGGKRLRFYGSQCRNDAWTFLLARPSIWIPNILHMALICRVPCWNVSRNWVKETANIKKHSRLLPLRKQKEGMSVQLRETE